MDVLCKAQAMSVEIEAISLFDDISFSGVTVYCWGLLFQVDVFIIVEADVSRDGLTHRLQRLNEKFLYSHTMSDKVNTVIIYKNNNSLSNFKVNLNW